MRKFQQDLGPRQPGTREKWFGETWFGASQYRVVLVRVTCRGRGEDRVEGVSSSGSIIAPISESRSATPVAIDRTFLYSNMAPRSTRRNADLRHVLHLLRGDYHHYVHYWLHARVPGNGDSGWHSFRRLRMRLDVSVSAHQSLDHLDCTLLSFELVLRTRLCRGLYFTVLRTRPSNSSLPWTILYCPSNSSFELVSAVDYTLLSLERTFNTQARARPYFGAVFRVVLSRTPPASAHKRSSSTPRL